MRVRNAMLISLVPSLMVPHVGHALDFYHRALGFEVAVLIPQGPPYEVALLSWGEVRLMLQSKAAFSLGADGPSLREPGGTFALNFQVRGLAELRGRVARHVQTIEPLHQTSYGTLEWTILDPHGYVLTFFEDLGRLPTEPHGAA